jgi:phage gp36-like protein
MSVSSIKVRYDAAIKTLKEISKGTIQIGGSPTGEASRNQLHHVLQHQTYIHHA